MSNDKTKIITQQIQDCFGGDHYENQQTLFVDEEGGTT